MSVRFNVTPKHAAERYALNRAQQRSETWGATTIPNTTKSALVRDVLDTNPAKKSLVEPRRGGPSDAELADTFWRTPHLAVHAFASALRTGPIHMSAVLDCCAVVAARDLEKPDLDTVRLNVRLRLEQSLRQAVQSSEDPMHMNAVKSLLHIAETTIADPESIHTDLSTALVYVDFARRAMIPDASDARLRSSIQKKAAALDALEAEGVAAFRARAETLITAAQEKVKGDYPDSFPAPGFLLLHKARRFLSDEQTARLDAVLVLNDTKRYPATDAIISGQVKELAGNAKFPDAHHILERFEPASWDSIDKAGPFLTDAEKEAARQAFAAHDAVVVDTRVAFQQLQFLAVVPAAGQA